MEHKNGTACRHETTTPSERIRYAFGKVMEDHGYHITEEEVEPLRREDLPEAIRSTLHACEPNTDKITGRFIGRIYESILGLLER